MKGNADSNDRESDEEDQEEDIFSHSSLMDSGAALGLRMRLKAGVSEGAPTGTSDHVPSASGGGSGGLPLTAAELMMAARLSSGASASGSSGSGSGELREASNVTGLAVAATCKRMKVFSRLDPARGVVMLEARELSRWLISKRAYDGAGGGAAGGGGNETGGFEKVQGRVAPSMMTMPAATEEGGSSSGSTGSRASGSTASRSLIVDSSSSVEEEMPETNPSAAWREGGPSQGPISGEPSGTSDAVERSSRQRRVYKQRQPEGGEAASGGTGGAVLMGGLHDVNIQAGSLTVGGGGGMHVSSSMSAPPSAVRPTLPYSSSSS